jgi:hypothetical protein
MCYLQPMPRISAAKITRFQQDANEPSQKEEWHNEANAL